MSATFPNGAAEKKEFVTAANRAVRSAETTDGHVTSHSCQHDTLARSIMTAARSDTQSLCS